MDENSDNKPGPSSEPVPDAVEEDEKSQDGAPIVEELVDVSFLGPEPSPQQVFDAIKTGGGRVFLALLHDSALMARVGDDVRKISDKDLEKKIPYYTARK